MYLIKSALQFTFRLLSVYFAYSNFEGKRNLLSLFNAKSYPGSRVGRFFVLKKIQWFLISFNLVLGVSLIGANGSQWQKKYKILLYKCTMYHGPWTKSDCSAEIRKVPQKWPALLYSTDVTGTYTVSVQGCCAEVESMSTDLPNISSPTMKR